MKEEYLSKQADRKKKQAESEVQWIIAPKDQMVFIKDKDHDGLWRNGHNDPRFYANGHYTEPTQAEMVVNKGSSYNPLLLLPETTNIPDLMPILDNAERVLVKGPSNAGKTTLFQNISARSENVIVIDPHYAPGIWPNHCEIVGKGREHKEIDLFFTWLSQELDRRYKLRADGDENYPSLTIIIDEWMSIANKCENSTSIITEMITESRKSKMRLFIGSHSDQVEALGIRGQGKLREGLLIVRLHYDQFTGERASTFDYGKGERACKVPTVAVVNKVHSKTFELPKFIEPDMIIEKGLSDKELKILEMVQVGASNKEIGRIVYNVDYPTGTKLYTINRIREMVAE